MKFNIDIEYSTAEFAANIEKVELESGVNLPSDYKHILLTCNELRLANDALAMIQDEQGEEISGLDGEIFSLNTFQHASDPYPSIEYIDEALASEVSQQFFSIATLFYQGILLIGKTKDNENQIYGFVPEYQETPFFLADNIFQFFNNRITVVQ